MRIHPLYLIGSTLKLNDHTATVVGIVSHTHVMVECNGTRQPIAVDILVELSHLNVPVRHERLSCA